MSNYYVADAAGGGDDGNSGLTELLPWLTVAKVNGSSFSAGDSILFNKGCTWREQLTVPSSGSTGNPITFGAYGTGDKPKILGSINKDSAGDWTNENDLWYWTYSTAPNIAWRDGARMTKVTNKVDLSEVGEWWMDDPNDRVYVYSGASAPTVGGHTFEFAQRNYCITATDKDYVTISGIAGMGSKAAVFFNDGGDYFTISGCTASLAGGCGIRSQNCSHPTITGNVVDHVGDMQTVDTAEMLGIASFASTDVLISGNTVSYSARAGIMLWSPASARCIIERNDVSYPGQVGDHAYGIQVYGDASGSTLSDVEIRYNYVHNCGHANVYLIDKLDDIRIHHNVLADAGSIGTGDMLANLTGFATSTSYKVTNLKVYNNVLYQGVNTPHGKHNIRIPVQSNWEGALFKNNIFYHVGSWGNDLTYCCNATHAAPPTFDRNVHYRPNDTEDAIFKIENVDLLWAARPAGFEDNGINANPLFTNAAGGDFTLQAGSPCINAGVNLGSTYQISLMPGSRWPSAVITGNQNEHGRGWEIGAYIRSRINAALAVGGS